MRHKTRIDKGSNKGFVPAPSDGSDEFGPPAPSAVESYRWREKKEGELGIPRRSLVGLRLGHGEPPSQPSNAGDLQRVDDGDRSVCRAQLLSGEASGGQRGGGTMTCCGRGSRSLEMPLPVDEFGPRVDMLEAARSVSRAQVLVECPSSLPRFRRRDGRPTRPL
jgi:hypothetical protein